MTTEIQKPYVPPFDANPETNPNTMKIVSCDGEILYVVKDLLSASTLSETGEKLAIFTSSQLFVDMPCDDEYYAHRFTGKLLRWMFTFLQAVVERGDFPEIKRPLELNAVPYDELIPPFYYNMLTEDLETTFRAAEAANFFNIKAITEFTHAYIIFKVKQLGTKEKIREWLAPISDLVPEWLEGYAKSDSQSAPESATEGASGVTSSE